MKKTWICAASALILVYTAFPAYGGQWQRNGEFWRYLQEDGTYVSSGWMKDTDGKWYYFDENGYMAVNEITPDGYVVGKDGSYIQGMFQDQDQAIEPWDYQQMLGRGMDVDWSKTKDGKNYYTSKTAADFRQAGIKHVRIRVKDDLDEELLEGLDRQIHDCLSNGLIPVLAYQADEFKNNPCQETIDGVTAWWRTAAERYQNKSHLLSFDLLIESSDALNRQPEMLNRMIEQCVAAIRETNPDRIIMMSPRLRSDPAYLSELKIPSAGNGYLMAEWHFYAAGPSRTNEKKLWTVGTEQEKKRIEDKIKSALDWQMQTGIPTWVGAWMPGNYNDGNDYSLEEQMVFAGFMCDSLEHAGIPFAVNSDTKFYDREKQEWIEEMIPLRNLIFQ